MPAKKTDNEIPEYPEEVNSVQEFLEAVEWIKGKLPRGGRTYFYRGLSDKNYDLQASVFREYKGGFIKNKESEMLKEFCATFYDETRGKTAFEKMMLAQHFRLPTRLLDVSLEPLVALYFACHKHKNGDDGCVYCFSVENKKILAPSSDKLYFISEMVFWDKSKQGHVIKLMGEGKDIFKSDNGLKDFKREAPSFFGSIKPVDLKTYFFVIPAYPNKRVRAQSGCFVLSGLIRKNQKLGKNPDHKAMGIIISKKAMTNILKELSDRGVSKKTLFPNMDKISEEIKAKYVEQCSNKNPKK